MNKSLRIGIVGMGNAGRMHLRALASGQVPDAVVTAVADRTAVEKNDADGIPSGVRRFASATELFASGTCEAVIIATPHPFHAGQSIAAFRAGLHVLCEKPAGITAVEARRMADVADECDRVYSLNLNRRTNGAFVRLRSMIRGGQLGTLRRIAWTSTDWLRLQSYYDTSPWRGTWKGEGGGMLLNQLPHAIDLWQWVCGMPTRLRAFCRFGHHHAIEVEDEATVYAEYANGASGVFIASTGEAPGTERIEIVGDLGQVVLESDRLMTVRLTAKSIREFIDTQPAGFASPEFSREQLVFEDECDLSCGITKNFVDAVLHGAELVAPGADGVNGLELANAMLLSGWTDRWCKLPCPHEEFERRLRECQAHSHLRIPAEQVVMTLEESFVSHQ